jgi:hypothetical protein
MSLMHNIRNFAEMKLQGVIPWSKFSFPDETHTDVSNVLIEGAKGTYRIVVSSSYAVPPLGKVVFKDKDQGHEIDGQNQDDTWHRIAEYLKARELDAGTAALLPYAGVTDEMRGVPPEPAPIAKIPFTPPLVPPVAFVFYISDPGVWYQNGPALVTRVNADGSYNLTVFPDGSEPFYRQTVGKQSDALRNVCWVDYPGQIPPLMIAGDDLDYVDLTPGYIMPMPAGSSELQAELESLRALVVELTERMGTLKASAFDQRKVA